MVLVVNSALCRFEHLEIFPWSLSVIVFAEALADNGMPTAVESELLAQVDDEIETAVLANHNAILASRSTWNGERQLLFRVHSAERANDVLQGLIAGNSARAWDFRMEQDPAWSAVSHYLQLAAPRADV